jgi:predicted glutamine amidotransferase
MCGLVGCAGLQLTREDSDAFYNLLHLDQLRGDHSTGIAVIKNNGDAELFKAVGPPHKLYEKYKGGKFIDGKLGWFNAVIYMGHNRFATQGKIDENGAHPFQMGDIIGAHNGTVQKHFLTKLEGHKQFEIDSQIIFHHLNATKQLQDIWDVADGAMALTWWNKVDGTLNFARNKERPLYYTISKDGKNIYWASEKWMLYIALGRTKIQFDNAEEVEINTHYKVLEEKGRLKIECSPLNPFVRKPYTYLPDKQDFKSWPRPEGEKGKGFSTGWVTVDFYLEKWVPNQPLIKDGPITSGHFLAKSFYGAPVKIFAYDMTERVRMAIASIDDQYDCSTYSSSTAWESADKINGVHYISCNFNTVAIDYARWDQGDIKKRAEDGVIIEYALGWKNSSLTREEFDKASNDGCANCMGDIYWSDRANVLWLGRDQVACPNCKDIDSVKQQVAA